MYSVGNILLFVRPHSYFDTLERGKLRSINNDEYHSLDDTQNDLIGLGNTQIVVWMLSLA